MTLPPPLYPLPPAEPVPRLDPELVDDDDELAKAVDQFVFLDPEASARVAIITMHQDALRVADAPSWPLYLRVDELVTERWADVIVLLARWAFHEGQRHPVPTPDPSNVSPNGQTDDPPRGSA